jgi:hypothetical protein
MAAGGFFFLPNRKNQGAVKVKGFDCGPSACRLPSKAHAVPLEVLRPVVASRIEKRYIVTTSRVRGYSSSALSQGTGYARQCKVVGNSLSSRADRDDVIYVKRGLLGRL